MMRSLVVASLLLAGCGGPAPVSTAGPALVKKLRCTSCHGADLSGSAVPIAGTFAYAGNLTSDPATGLGMWSDDQILAAVRDDPCTVMPSFPLTSAEAADLLTYLRGLAPVSHATPTSDCTGPVAGDLDDAGPQDAAIVILSP